MAPPLGSARDLNKREAAPLAVKPRKKSGALVAGDMANPDADHSSPAPESIYKPTRKRSVSPTAVISEKHQERSNALIFFKILCAVLLVALIVAGVYLWLKSAS